MQTTQFPNSHSVHEPMTPPTIGTSDLKILKVLSLLIDYPNNELFSGDTLADCTEIIARSTLISPEVRTQIIDLIEDLIDTGCLEAQARYDVLFARGLSLSL